MTPARSGPMPFGDGSRQDVPEPDVGTADRRCRKNKRARGPQKLPDTRKRIPVFFVSCGSLPPEFSRIVPRGGSDSCPGICSGASVSVRTISCPALGRPRKRSLFSDKFWHCRAHPLSLQPINLTDAPAYGAGNCRGVCCAGVRPAFGPGASNLQRHEFHSLRRAGAQGLRHGHGRCRTGRFGRYDRFHLRNLRRVDRLDPQRRCHGSAAARAPAPRRAVAPHQRQFPAARAVGHRRRDLLACPADDLSAAAPPDRDLVVLLRPDHRLGAARCPTGRALGLAFGAVVRRRRRRRMVDHRCHADRDTQRLVVRHAVGSHCHLCHDPARHLGGLHPAAARQVPVHHAGGRRPEHPGDRHFRRGSRGGYHLLFAPAVVAAQAVA